MPADVDLYRLAAWGGGEGARRRCRYSIIHRHILTVRVIIHLNRSIHPSVRPSIHLYGEGGTKAAVPTLRPPASLRFSFLFSRPPPCPSPSRLPSLLSPTRLLSLLPSHLPPAALLRPPCPSPLPSLLFSLPPPFYSPSRLAPLRPEAPPSPLLRARARTRIQTHMQGHARTRARTHERTHRPRRTWRPPSCLARAGARRPEFKERDRRAGTNRRAGACAPAHADGRSHPHTHLHSCPSGRCHLHSNECSSTDSTPPNQRERQA